MLLKVFKVVLLGAAVLFGQQASAGIPVYCYNCQDASHNAAHSILDGLRSQTEAIVNAWGYAIKSQAKVELTKDTALIKTELAIENAKTYDPILAKPDTACTTYNSASLRSAVAGASGGAITNAIVGIAKGHNQSSAKLSETEPKRDYFVGKVIDRLDVENKDDSISGAKILLAQPFREDELASKLEEAAFLTNPFPLETPTEKSLKYIKEKGSTGDRDAMARVLVTNDRIAASQAVIMDEIKKDARLYDAGPLGKYIKEIGASLSKDQRDLLVGKLSANQIDELTATYRVRAPSWSSKTMSKGSVGIAKEQVLTQAEILNQLWEIKELLRNMKIMQAYADTRSTVQSGATKQ